VLAAAMRLARSAATIGLAWITAAVRIRFVGRSPVASGPTIEKASQVFWQHAEIQLSWIDMPLGAKVQCPPGYAFAGDECA